jgi:hypothetical protein
MYKFNNLFIKAKNKVLDKYKDTLKRLAESDIHTVEDSDDSRGRNHNKNQQKDVESKDRQIN